MDRESVIELLIAIGTGSLLTTLVSHFIDWAKGRTAEERTAWAERDREARARRMLEETLHATRRVAQAHGARDEDLPAWPTY